MDSSWCREVAIGARFFWSESSAAMTRNNVVLGACLFSLFVCSMPTRGQNIPRSSPPQLSITAAQVDFGTGSVLISGKNLGDAKTFSGVVTLSVPTRGDL